MIFHLSIYECAYSIDSYNIVQKVLIFKENSKRAFLCINVYLFNNVCISLTQFNLKLFKSPQKFSYYIVYSK